MLEKKMSNNYFQPKSYRTNKIGFNVIQVTKKKKKSAGNKRLKKDYIECIHFLQKISILLED